MQHQIIHSTAFERDLRDLQHLALQIAETIQIALGLATDSLLSCTVAPTLSALEALSSIGRLETEIDRLSIRLLALRQPMAQDLRQIVTTIKITVHLKRIGEYVAHVARRSNWLIEQHLLPENYKVLLPLLSLLQANLGRVVQALAIPTVEKTVEIYLKDEEIDKVYTHVFDDIISYMTNHAQNTKECTSLLFIAKHLERVGDHLVDIAESLHYTLKGYNLPRQQPRS